MIKIAVIFIGIAIFASSATFARYGNFNPCDWTAQDHAGSTAIPKIVWAGRLKAKFLLEGIAQPSYSDCMLTWWASRAEDAVEKAGDAVNKTRN